jgi:rhodanese-related sulfurtransferase
MKKCFMKIAILNFIATCLIVVGCNSQTSKAIQITDCNTFETAVKAQKNLQLIDVRTAEEFAEYHVLNAQNINYNNDLFTITVEKLNKNEPIFVYCKAGGRSAKAAQKLAELGFAKIYDLEGGIINWIENKKPIIK